MEIAAKSPEKPQLQIMSNLFKQAFGSDTVQQMRKLPVAQKLILCVLYQSHTEGAYIAVSDLNTEYLKVCAKKGLQAVDESFIKILSLMVCSGLVEMKDLRGKSMLREVCARTPCACVRCWYAAQTVTVAGKGAPARCS